MCVLAIDQAHNFRSAACVASELAKHCGGDQAAAGLFDASDGHAGMGCFNNDSNASCVDLAHEKFRDFAGESFLQLRPAGEAGDDPSELADSDDLSMWQITNMSLSHKG